MLPHEATSIVGSRFIDDSSLIFHYSFSLVFVADSSLYTAIKLAISGSFPL